MLSPLCFAYDGWLGKALGCRSDVGADLIMFWMPCLFQESGKGGVRVELTTL